MADIFLKIVNMSISACWIVLAIILLRFVLKKAPKWINCLLWGIAGLRLVMPFSFESVFSLIPSAETISKPIDSPRPHFESGVPIVDSQVNDYLKGNYFEGVTRPAGNFVDITTILAIVWVVGIVVLLVYTAVSFIRLKGKIGTAILLRDNIYQSEAVVSPFVLGIIKPKIYLPFNMNEQDMEHVIAHEQAHLHRKDYLWKPLGFLIVTLHWFNPMVWIGYILLCRDIELACDEKVVKEFNNEQKADYSQALLTCSVNRRMIAACPVAFGEVGVKNRVKSVLNYKKPAFWLIIVAIIISMVVAVCFLTNPQTSLDDELSVFLDTQIADHHYSEGYTDDNFIAVHHKVLGVEKSVNKITVYMWVLYHEYSCENGEIKLETGTYIPTVITAEKTGLHRHYRLVEYWEPHDGTLYVDDIKGKFPLHLQEKALDSQRYIGEQLEFCENAAKEYFDSEADYGSMEKLENIYPQFFDVSTDGGLTVYIWQMAEDDYKCYLVNTAQEAISDNSFAYAGGATISEMRAILSTYDVNNEDVTIQPVINPLSSYFYEIDDIYCKYIKDLFWSTLPLLEPTAFGVIIDSSTFDIDNDGKDEHCVLTYGPTSGIFTIVFTAIELGEEEPEYINTFNYLGQSAEFYKTKNDEVKIKCIYYDYENGSFDEPKKKFLDIEIENGNIVLKDGAENIPYWGEQGVEPSKFLRKQYALEEAVGEVVLRENNGKYFINIINKAKNPSAKAFEAHEILHRIKDDEKDILTVYAVTLYEEYNLENGKVVSVGSGAAPVEIVFSTKDDLKYTLKNYRVLPKEENIEDYILEDAEYDDEETMIRLEADIWNDVYYHYGIEPSEYDDN
ncbi:MAG: M56 family metallopeptidase [Acutalibacteraceae bacterium]|nr:M56 family metallopeptidase [Acutalibacteraceae bacterium]